jgi:hypothetical protein
MIEMCREVAQERRFPHPGFASDENQATSPCDGLCQKLTQVAKKFVAFQQIEERGRC